MFGLYKQRLLPVPWTPCYFGLYKHLTLSRLALCCPAGSLDSMFGLYKQLLPELGGYLTHAGELSRTRLETFMGKLAEAEADVLQSRAEVSRVVC